ncbi:hypothetical protein ZC03_002 [Pseudomonas phage ZC03]|uniref:Uncharacterized protein n=1 Tax=Pseudomonas phage ZC03 TaxID=1622115 RepID=A0A1L2C904_9CAUD|nr:tail assembly protein [Pseudomonas phage ZC03]AMD43389.1 hypothetical protein ZC03_002 [Pseudomonas phage ZC03]
MSTPQFYCWDDDGSPARNLSGNMQNRLKQILVPCLVTGYGSKTGAGWTVGHEHPNGFSLINADGNVVNFVSNLPAQAPYPAMNSGVIHIYAAESLIDTSSAIIDGANLCSGTYRKGLSELSNYPRHDLSYANYSMIDNLSTLQWVLVADNKTFILNCSTAPSSSNSSVSYCFTLYAGKSLLDTEFMSNFVVLGGNISNYSSYGYPYAFCVGYSSPINPSTGLSERVEVGTQPYRSTYNNYSSAQTTKPLSRLNLQQPRLFYGNDFVGRLRGVVYDDVLRSVYGWEEHLKVLGFSGANFTDRGKLALIDGYNYAFARSISGNSILTDNPAFW